MNIFPKLFPRFVAQNVYSIINECISGFARAKMEEPGRMKRVTGTCNKKEMGCRDRGIREKATKDVRPVAEVRLRNREVDRLRHQHLIKGNPKGSQEAGTGNNMR